jgi:hypothetical protein
MTATQTRAAHVETRAPLPLYLYGKKSTRVDADGPALRVRIADTAPLRYPLVRIARIIVGPRVEWQANALQLCQQHGLPIVFLDSAGEPTGYLLPAQSKPSRLDDVIEEMLDRADWSMHYSPWLRAQRMQLLHDWLHARQTAGQTTQHHEYRELVRRHVYQPETEAVSYPHESVQAGAITAYTLQTLQRGGLKPRYWGDNGSVLELARDLSQLLQLALHLEMYGMGSSLHGDNATLLRILHSYSQQMITQLPRLLGSLHRHFRAQLEAWR